MTSEMTEQAAGQTVGFIGLGNMGTPMAARLVAAGHHVRGFDSSDAARRTFGQLPGAGSATPVAELAQAGQGAAAVILMLPDSDIVERVVLGRLAAEASEVNGPEDGSLLASLPPGTVIIDMSSSDPARTRLLAARTATTGVTLIDAPVSGGVTGARAGTLTVMVGGPAETFDRFRPLLQAIGQRVVHAGDTGSGHAVKALNNLMSAANLLIASEALIAGQRFGLDPNVMLEIINGSSGRSTATETKWPNFVLQEKFEAGFAARLMVKDIKLALEIEHAAGVPATASEAVVAVWEAALPNIPPEADHTAIARWVSAGRQEAPTAPPPPTD